MRILRTLIVAAAVMSAAAPASGSIARSVSFDEKVQAADAIVLGRVVATESRWDPQRRWILTYSTIEVDRAIKGTPAPRLTLVTPGGTVEGIRQETIGAPALRPGDERVLFVRSTASGPTVAFMDQGVHVVHRDGSGRVMVAAAPSSAVALDAVTGAAAAGPARELSLDEFAAQVERAGLRPRMPSQMAAAPAEVQETGWGADLAAFARDHWKVLALAGFGILLALVPFILRARSSGV